VMYGDQDLMQCRRSSTTSNHCVAPYTWDPSKTSDPSVVLDFLTAPARPAWPDPASARYILLCGVLFTVCVPWEDNRCPWNPSFSLFSGEMSLPARTSDTVLCIPDDIECTMNVVNSNILFVGTWTARQLFTHIAVGRFVFSDPERSRSDQRRQMFWQEQGYTI